MLHQDSMQKDTGIYFSPNTFYQTKDLMRVFRVVVWSLSLFAIFSLASNYFETVLAACLIGFFALLPAYLWCKGSVKGMPVFPVFALPFLWTYGLPLLVHHPDVELYSPVSHLWAAPNDLEFFGARNFCLV